MAKKDKGVLTGEPVTCAIPSPAGGVQMETFIPWTLVKRGVKRKVITPLDAPEAFRDEAAAEREKCDAAQPTPLVRALGLAHYWQRLLDEGIDFGQASRIFRLTQLAPDIVEAGVAGEADGLTLERLARSKFPANWEAQRGQLRTQNA